MCDGGEVPRHDPILADVNADAAADEVQREVQRLLDLVPGTSAAPELALDCISPPNEDGDITALELDLGAWESSIGLPQPVF